MKSKYSMSGSPVYVVNAHRCIAGKENSVEIEIFSSYEKAKKYCRISANKINKDFNEDELDFIAIKGTSVYMWSITMIPVDYTKNTNGVREKF